MSKKRSFEEMENWAEITLEFLGKNEVFETRSEAIKNMTKTNIQAEGKLLGGKLTISLEFDERRNDCDQFKRDK